jgi:lactoylglutathione lyase
MKLRFAHNNINVFDLDKSIAFYENAIGLSIVRKKGAEDGSYQIVFMEDGDSAHQLELTWLRDRKEPYNLGDNEVHLAFRADDFDAAYAHHKELGVIVYENTDMGVYFIEDPDGYWVEIIPTR